MPRYDPSHHPMLSAEAKRLGPVDLEEHAELAEDLLELSATRYSGAKAESARRAVVLQVNHQVAMGAAPSAVQSESRGSRSVTYRQGPGGEPVAISSAALAVVRGIAGDTWRIAGSLR